MLHGRTLRLQRSIQVRMVVPVTRSRFLILPFDLASTILAIPVATAGPEGRARNHPAFRPGMP